MAKQNDSVRIQVTMTKVMSEKVKKKSEELGLSMSSAVNVLVSQGLQADDATKALSELMQAYKEEKK